MIECGVHRKDILKGIDFDPSKLLACFISHEHSDHSKSHEYIGELGINVFCSEECGKKIGSKDFITIENSETYYLGIIEANYVINCFDLKHDVPCKGFTISHPECGNIVFITDTIYSPIRFENVNHIMIEANYCEEYIKKADIHPALKNRIVNSHMSIQNCEKFISMNDTSNLYSVVLLHMSDSNSNEKEFVRTIKRGHPLTNVYAANNGDEITLSNNPF